METYDVIVIGAGNAGLTAAAALAQGGAQVLVLERHNIPGGCATSFCRGRFEFEVALHQLSGIGTPAKPGPLRMVLDQLKVADRLDFVPMTDLYHVVIPDTLDILLEPDRARTIAALKEHFPGKPTASMPFSTWFTGSSAKLSAPSTSRTRRSTRINTPCISNTA